MGWRLSKKFAFEAAHCLTHLPAGHKCARPHGHSYVVEVIIHANYLDERGFAGGVDYGDLDAFGNLIKEQFDHQDLNIVMKGGENTTAEMLAKHFYDWCASIYPHMEAVRVYETAKTYCEYCPWSKHG